MYGDFCKYQGLSFSFEQWRYSKKSVQNLYLVCITKIPYVFWQMDFLLTGVGATVKFPHKNRLWIWFIETLSRDSPAKCFFYLRKWNYLFIAAEKQIKRGVVPDLYNRKSFIKLANLKYTKRRGVLKGWPSIQNSIIFYAIMFPSRIVQSYIAVFRLKYTF